MAMESTGVYWIALFELLEARGFTVFLVNARHVKNVAGRKSDVLDCQWLQQLMTYGLLRGHSARPSRSVCCARCTASAPCCCAARAGMCSTCKRRSPQMNDPAHQRAVRRGRR
ncbi:MAG: IS110 family transposase, partial [Rhizobiales bacterium]|nr:IS110 family transposase [Hyphomicrobiales bacterium]